MNVAYAKLGRSLLIDPSKWGAVGGDNESLALLLQLARRHPDVTWTIAGRWGGDPSRLPKNVAAAPVSSNVEEGSEQVAALYEAADGAVVWLGQHGTSNQPVPFSDGSGGMTKPQESFKRYSGPIIKGLNRVDDRYEPVWLCADPRNYLKARDLKWYPRTNSPILGQFNWARRQTHYRYGDPQQPQLSRAKEHTMWGSPEGFWDSPHRYVASGLELTGVPRWEDQAWPSWEDRAPFGVVANENRAYVSRARGPIVKEWVLPLEPEFLHGKWSDEGQEALGVKVEPVRYQDFPSVMSGALSTLTTPASGSGWATAKPWECFALGTVCFFHPDYDTQNNILPEGQLRGWLRPSTAAELRERVSAVARDRTTYEWLRDRQHELLVDARFQNECIGRIEERLGLPLSTGLTGPAHDWLLSA